MASLVLQDVELHVGPNRTCSISLWSSGKRSTCRSWKDPRHLSRGDREPAACQACGRRRAALPHASPHRARLCLLSAGRSCKKNHQRELSEVSNIRRQRFGNDVDLRTRRSALCDSEQEYEEEINAVARRYSIKTSIRSLDCHRRSVVPAHQDRLRRLASRSAR